MRTRHAVATATHEQSPPEQPPQEQSALLPMVDEALQQMVGRGLIESIEVVDLLLDLRSRMVLERAFGQMTDTNQSKEGN